VSFALAIAKSFMQEERLGSQKLPSLFDARLKWLRGLDLNQRPLGYEGKTCPKSGRRQPIKCNKDTRLKK
jgi:hypothetical protein